MAEYGESSPRITGTIIKWYQVKESYEDKYRFGHMTIQEYNEWMEELKNKAEEEEAKKDGPGTGATAGKTFWQDDNGKRLNMSSSDYTDFLSQNNINVSNSATVDIESLLNEGQ